MPACSSIARQLLPRPRHHPRLPVDFLRGRGEEPDGAHRQRVQGGPVGRIVGPRCRHSVVGGRRSNTRRPGARATTSSCTSSRTSSTWRTARWTGCPRLDNREQRDAWRACSKRRTAHLSAQQLETAHAGRPVRRGRPGRVLRGRHRKLLRATAGASPRARGAVRRACQLLPRRPGCVADACDREYSPSRLPAPRDAATPMGPRNALGLTAGNRAHTITAQCPDSRERQYRFLNHVGTNGEATKQARAARPRRHRQEWGTRVGIILAVAGSAVGLGNFLRFPGQAAQNGGGAFMIPYFCALLFLGRLRSGGPSGRWGVRRCRKASVPRRRSSVCLARGRWPAPLAKHTHDRRRGMEALAPAVAPHRPLGPPDGLCRGTGRAGGTES